MAGQGGGKGTPSCPSEHSEESRRRVCAATGAVRTPQPDSSLRSEGQFEGPLDTVVVLLVEFDTAMHGRATGPAGAGRPGGRPKTGRPKIKKPRRRGVKESNRAENAAR